MLTTEIIIKNVIMNIFIIKLVFFKFRNVIFVRGILELFFIRRKIKIILTLRIMS